MGVYVGGATASAQALGAVDLAAGHVGTEQVWPAATPGPLVAMWDFEGAEPEKDVVAGRALAFDPNVSIGTYGGAVALAAPAASGEATTADGFLNPAGFSIAMWVWTPSALIGTSAYSVAAFMAGEDVVAELYSGLRTLGPSLFTSSRVSVTTDTGTYNRVAQAQVPGGVIPPQFWTHVAGTYDGATLTLYVDGNKALDGPKAGLVMDPDSFAVDVVATSAVKNVGIWNEAISAAEIATLYAAGPTG